LPAGATIRSAPPPRRAAAVTSALAAARDNKPAGDNGRNTYADTRSSARLSPDVIHVIDGYTFEARWPGLNVDTEVRLRDVDAPELHARCAEELAKAQAARAALETILAAGGVTISQVGIDKYGGRVDAAVATHDTADVSAALLTGGWARN